MRSSVPKMTPPAVLSTIDRIRRLLPRSISRSGDTIAMFVPTIVQRSLH